MSKKAKRENEDLINLLKVFDLEYLSAEGCGKLAALNPNDKDDVRKAVNFLLVSEFQSFLPVEKGRILESLRLRLADENENFSALFAQVSPAFEIEVKAANRRNFMAVLQEELSSYM